MEPLWLLGASLAPLWASFEAPWGHFLGSLEVLLAAVGCLRGPLGSLGVPGTFLGDSGAISGIFREIPGGLLARFWDGLWCFFALFLDFVFR